MSGTLFTCKQTRQKLLTILLSLGLTFAPYYAYSLTFTIRDLHMNLRYNSNDVLERITTMAPNTVVRIPDEYIPENIQEQINDNTLNETDREQVILNWLRTGAGEAQTYRDNDGELQQEHFIPIEVVSSPWGNVHPGQRGEVAIRFIALHDGINLRTERDAPFIPQRAGSPTGSPPTTAPAGYSPGTGTTAPPAPPRTLTDITNDIIANACSTPNLLPGGVIRDLAGSLSSVLEEVDNVVDNRLSQLGTIDSVRRNWEATCGQIVDISFDQFIQQVRQEATANNVPPELILGIMQHESNGRCTAANPENYGGRNLPDSVGLFQINEGSSSIGFCSAAQVSSQTNSFPLNNNIANPNCLENPITNMREAIRILRAKYAAVNDNETPPSSINWAQMGDTQRDLWRKAVSAYNGGEGNVHDAYRGVTAYNQCQGTNYDPDNWEVRRLFMFRWMLGNVPGCGNITTAYHFNRNEMFSVGNVAYVETITGRSNSNPAQRNRSLATDWSAYLRDQ